MCILEDEDDEAAADQRIEAFMRESKALDKRTHKLLLLGAGESGKSTIVKQMRILHGSGYTDDDLRYFKPILQSTIIGDVRQLVRALDMDQVREALGRDVVIPPELEDAVKKVNSWGTDEIKLDQERGAVVKRLWSHPIVKEVFAVRNLFHLQDNFQYFLDRVEEISQNDYTPGIAEMIMSRVRSVGIVEHDFTMSDKSTFKIVDVGGQRSERRKWIHSFSNVDAILFVAAISEYDQVCWEDNTEPRINESIKIFEDVLSVDCLAHAAIIIFLNKTDIFMEKLVRAPLAEFFPSYHGNGSFEDAAIFMKELYASVGRKIAAQRGFERPLYFHFTTATDRDNIDKVFNDVRTIVMRSALKKHNLI